MDPAWSHWPSKSPLVINVDEKHHWTGIIIWGHLLIPQPLMKVVELSLSSSGASHFSFPPCIFPPLVGLSLMSVVSVLLPHPWAPRGSLAQISWSCPQLWQDMFVLTQQQWSLSGLCFKHRNKPTTHEKHGRVGGGVVKPDFTFPPEWLLLPSSFQPYCSSTMISYRWNL